MKAEQKRWVYLIAGTTLALGGLGYLIWDKRGDIEAGRAKVADLRGQIQASRKLLTGTPALEKEVIVLRETEDAIKEILPDERLANDLARTIREFEEQSDVRISSLKPKKFDNRGKKVETDFEKLGYQISLEGDAFQLLAFMDRIESHSRFMAITGIKLQAAPRRQVIDKGLTQHKIQLDVETYVYTPSGVATQVKIDNFERHKELLLGVIARRKQLLAIPSYEYRGARARRDPWIDPRIPAQEATEDQLPMSEQIAIVDGLSSQAKKVLETWDKIPEAPNVIVEMTLRAELEQLLARLEDDVRAIQDQGTITYPAADRRFAAEVLEPIGYVRKKILEITIVDGPSLEALREVHDAMTRHLAVGNHEMALSAFATVEPRLEVALKDPQRKALVESIRRKAQDARTLNDFARRKIEIKGVAIMQGRPPIALINGKALGEGDFLDEELGIKSIRQGEIEFTFRGVVLVKRF